MQSQQAEEIVVRSMRVEDAEAYIAFLHQLDRETKFLLWEPGERTLDASAARHRILSQNPATRLYLIAEMDGEIVGFLAGIRGARRRIAHRADLAMGVLERAQGRGIGRELLARLEEWAHSQGIRRLELTVMANNARAIRLYEKNGYVHEGRKRNAVVVDGEPGDELIMAKLLDS